MENKKIKLTVSFSLKPTTILDNNVARILFQFQDIICLFAYNHQPNMEIFLQQVIVWKQNEAIYLHSMKSLLSSRVNVAKNLDNKFIASRRKKKVQNTTILFIR